MGDKLFVVGQYIEKFNKLTGQQIPCGDIYQSVGLVTHVRNHHPGKEGLVALVGDVIRSPDYIGKHPKEPNSIELVKKISGNAMVCIKLDTKRNYLFVASVFEISEGKLKNRLNSGRLKPY